ncbi:MAG: transketolase [Selenomonadaceae bacterium]|nr:transketolase [Selenomonadaceae bacterium]
MNNIEKICVDAIRVLSADAIQKANSGHPGMPLGASPAAYELWTRHMKHNPKNPEWINRDRFILSAGHASAMLYSLLHLFGYGLTIDDLKNFRQENSLTPGHPEYGSTKGVEATTGPLGAGIGMAVGMAMAEKHLAEIFNKPNFPIVDHYTFVMCGDGCLMEGTSAEAFSLAGTLGLSKLIVLYDCNKITIEGSTDLTFTENILQRMAAYGFQTISVEDGNNLEEIGRAIETAKSDKDRPSFIKINTEIGYGSPKHGSASSHGEPLGEENVTALKKFLNYPEEKFFVPEEVYNHIKKFADEGAKVEEEWNKLFADYAEKYPDDKKLWDKYYSEIDAEKLFNDENFWTHENKTQATRAVSGNIINYLKNLLPNLIGGSADLGPSNKTLMKDAGSFGKENYAGRNIHFGVREIAMAAVANGLYLHGGLRPYVGTFFVFSEYMKPLVRIASLMKIPMIYIFTHDSIGVGEDGPTHEPIEQLAMFRSQPNINVFRPADAVETAAGWYLALTSKNTPTALILTRQNLPPVENSGRDALKGAYIISESKKEIPDGILIATGSEVSVAIDAQAELEKENIFVRVVSMPCMELFEQQSDEYKEKILPKNIRARVAVEAGTNFGWGNYVGMDGDTVTMKNFGASAPANVLFKKFGFTKENISEVMKSVIKKISQNN